MLLVTLSINIGLTKNFWSIDFCEYQNHEVKHDTFGDRDCLKLTNNSKSIKWIEKMRYNSQIIPDF